MVWLPCCRRNSQQHGSTFLMAVVAFLGEVRKAAGRATIGLDAGTVAELLTAFREAISPGFAGMLCKDGDLQPDVEVLVNGRNIQFLELLETCLRPTDQVTIFHSGVRGVPGG